MMDLIKFVHHYEKKTNEMRLAKLEEDYHYKQGCPCLQVRSGILNHAARVYTNKMFSFFEKEYVNCMVVRLKEVCNDRGVCVYEANEECQQKVYIVQYNPMTMAISYSCKLFESMRMFCRHALKVFNLNNPTSLPFHCISKRWTKEAKKGIVVTYDRLSSNNIKSSQTLRLSELMHVGMNVYNIASMTNSGTAIVKEKLVEIIKLLEEDLDIINVLERNLEKGKRKASDHPNHDNVIHESSMLNPPIVRTKRITNARLKRQHKHVPISGSQHPIVFNTTPYHSFNMSDTLNLYDKDTLQLPIGHYNSSYSSIVQSMEQMPHLSQV
ncbi:hypothetical protein Ddye_008153 [Dipteronia dyeriana]|uniref:Protein FAR1-RELATED SEQUENCE n=1 Tax=Dipteronia dyeriana TaxID=168575 RepID=A0AAD9X9D5_9ROSI|nr:hypothetical protein Ddye_008153 [Dipteronia dyeriana]